MLNLKTLMSAAFTAGIALAVRSDSHPFVGANSELSNVQRADGSLAIRMKQRKTLVPKHDYLREKSGEFH